MFFLNHQKEPKNEPQTGGKTLSHIPQGGMADCLIVSYNLFWFNDNLKKKNILQHHRKNGKGGEYKAGNAVECAEGYANMACASGCYKYMFECQYGGKDANTCPRPNA